MKKEKKNMIQAAKIIVIGLATIGLIGAGVGIGVGFNSLILGVVLTALILCLTIIVLVLFLNIDDDLVDMPMPGVKCPTCASRGIEQWVLPGKHCPRCSTACRVLHETGLFNISSIFTMYNIYGLNIVVILVTTLYYLYI